MAYSAYEVEQAKIHNGWSTTASATNGVATATTACDTNGRHFVQGVRAAFSTSASGVYTTQLLTILDNGAAIFQTYLQNLETFNFPAPLKCTRGGKVEAVLGASGTGGIIGVVSMWGFTVPDLS